MSQAINISLLTELKQHFCLIVLAYVELALSYRTGFHGLFPRNHQAACAPSLNSILRLNGDERASTPVKRKILIRRQSFLSAHFT
jgi:hypothetical protein